MASFSYGVVVASNPFGNTSAPSGIGSEPTDPGFGYVGQVKGSTGVYLGNGWVLTADHVGAGNFTLGGTTYNYDGTNSHRIGGVDLRLFKLSSAPALAPLTISTTTPSLNDDVVMIGAGRKPTGSTPTTWHVDTDDPANWVWDTSSFPDADTTKSGFITNTTKEVRWGTNVVDGIDTGVTYWSYAPMEMIVTDFDETGGTAFESQAVLNDSGSGVFVDHGSGWELAGTIVDVDIYDNQPGGNSSALFGNLTHAIDLSSHASEINGYYLVPVPESASFALFLLLSSLLRLSSRRSGVAQAKTRGCRRFL
ncbi:MAG TPA: hypothetical protein VJ952_04780 [Opitutales bacterium]|nr:hypothetical protein [Opitutales bacterium]